MENLENRVKVKILKGVLSQSKLEYAKSALKYINELEEQLKLYRVNGSSCKDAIMHYDRLIKSNLSKTFVELRDHGTHADFCDKINDIRTEAILNYR